MDNQVRFLDIACIGCYLAIPVLMIFGISVLEQSVGVGLVIIFFGSILSLALATVFQYVGRKLEDGAFDKRSDKPLTNLSGTPWEKKK